MQAAAAALVLALSAPAWAQGTGATGGAGGTAGAAAPAAAASSPAKKELVQRVLKLNQSGIEGVGEQLANQTAGQAMQAAGSALGSVPEARREAVAKEIQAEVKKFYDEIAPILRQRAVQLAPGTVGAAFEERFTEEELRTLIAWLESPVSRKYQQIAGDMQGALTQKVVAESRAQVEPKIKALDQKLAAKFNQPAPAKPATPPAQAPAKK
jgi:hypothetical protein